MITTKELKELYDFFKEETGRKELAKILNKNYSYLSAVATGIKEFRPGFQKQLDKEPFYYRSESKNGLWIKEIKLSRKK